MGKNEDVLLPANLEAAQKLLKQNGLQYAKEVYPYIKTSLVYGRPLNQAIICVIGDSDSEKLATLSCLFQDCDISSSSDFILQTEEIFIVNKPLKVTSACKPIVGFLSFIFVSGYNNSQEVDCKNFRDLKKFRKSSQFERSMSDCTNYKGLVGRSGLSIRRSAFPNLVLFFTTASHDHSDVEASLRSLLTTDVVDTKYPNLIIVVTNAADLSPTKHDFLVSKKKLNDTIQNFVAEIFKITSVPIIYIENRTDIQLPKSKTGFKILPDGQLSHQNLLEAMQQLFNGQDGHFEDVLGKIIVGMYAQSNSNEKNDETDLEIGRLNLLTTFKYGNDLSFLNLGKGFCPASGEVKLTSLLSPGPTQEIEINCRKFRIPPNVSGFTEIQTNIFTEETTQKNKKTDQTSYSTTLSSTILGMDFANLSMPVSHKVNEKSSSEYCTLQFVIEKQIAIFKIDDPHQILNCMTFIEHFNTLGGRYFEADNKIIYDNFFDTWGTHFITQQGVGGAMYIRVEIKKSELTDETSRKIAAQLKFAFVTNLGGVGAEYENLVKELNSFGFKNEEIKIMGGTDQPAILSFKDIKPEMFKIWNDTLMNAPANLILNRKIMSYHQLITQNTEMISNIKEAAIEYLKLRPNQSSEINEGLEVDALQFE